MLGRHILAKALEALAQALDEVGEKDSADACARAAARLSRPEAKRDEDPFRAPFPCRAFRGRPSDPGVCSLCFWSFECHEKREGAERGPTPFETRHEPICLEDPCPWHGPRSDRIAKRRGT